MIGRWSIAPVRGRAVWSVWLDRAPTRARFEVSDARGEAADVHAARQEAFAALSRARGVTRAAEIGPIFALADDRRARGVEPLFPGDRARRRRAEPATPRHDDALLLPLEILGLAPPVTAARARAAYRARALECHPDRGGSHERMLALNRAFAQVREALERGPR